MDPIGNSATVSTHLLGRERDGSVAFKGRGRVREVLQAYWLAVLSVMACLVVRYLLDPILQNHMAYGLFIIPVLLTGWRGGLGPAMIATALSLVCAFWFFVQPRYEIAAPDAVGWIELTGYVLTALLISWYTDRLNRARRGFAEGAAEGERQNATLRHLGQELEQVVQQRTAEIERLKGQLQEENCYVRENISMSRQHSRLVGQTPVIRRVLSQIEQVAPTLSTVLLLGETGTGKELLAETVHELSARRGRTLVSVNCATMPATLVESELFGREKGAFTGSLSRRRMHRAKRAATRQRSPNNAPPMFSRRARSSRSGWISPGSAKRQGPGLGRSLSDLSTLTAVNKRNE